MTDPGSVSEGELIGAVQRLDFYEIVKLISYNSDKIIFIIIRERERCNSWSSSVEQVEVGHCEVKSPTY